MIRRNKQLVSYRIQEKVVGSTSPTRPSANSDSPYVKALEYEIALREKQESLLEKGKVATHFKLVREIYEEVLRRGEVSVRRLARDFRVTPKVALLITKHLARKKLIRLKMNKRGIRVAQS